MRNIILGIVIIMLALFIGLKVGISVPTFSIGQYQVEKLYIKLNKKLTLKAQKVVIPKTKSSPSFQNIDKVFHNVKYLLTFFDSIELNEIDFQNNTFNILFVDNILYMVSNDYEIAGNIERIGEKLVADISLLYIKKEKINIDAKVMYYLNKDKLEVMGHFEAYEINGTFAAKKEKKLVDFSCQSETFTNLRKVIKRFALKPAIERWIIDEIKAKNYKLYSFAGKGDIEEDGFKLDVDSLRGKILFDNVTIQYHPQLSPIVASSFLLHYKKGNLYFDLKQPTYEERDLEGSSVRITNIVGKEPTILVLDLKIHSQIDSVVQKILQAYKLNIPVKQQGERANLNIVIELPLTKEKQKIEVRVDVKLPRGDVWIQEVRLPVKSGRVSYREGEIILRDVYLQESWYRGKVNGSIDLHTKKATLKFQADEVSIGAKEKYFLLKEKEIPLTLSYKDGVKVSLPTLKTNIYGEKKGIKIVINDIRKIKPYIQNIGLKMDGGRLNIVTKDFNTYQFNGVLKRKSCFFYDKKNLCHTQVPFTGNLKGDVFHFYAFKKRLHYQAKKGRLNLTHLNLDLEAFLSSRDSLKKGKKKRLHIVGKKSKVRYGPYTLVTDNYSVKISSKGVIDAEGMKDGDKVKFHKKGNTMRIEALRVKDTLLHPLINFKGLKGGRYSLKKWGNYKKEMKGEILIEGGLVSDFKAYNNTLAFINTLPALMTLHSPGFSEKGFKIKKGKVQYRMIGDKIIFDSIYVKGESATIVGKGVLHLKKRTIRMDLAIQTAREFGSVIGNIPLLGYILMGKDKSMTVGLKVSGTLDNPKVETSAAKEILTLPFEIIKRVFETPAHLLNQ